MPSGGMFTGMLRGDAANCTRGHETGKDDSGRHTTLGRLLLLGTLGGRSYGFFTSGLMGCGGLTRPAMPIELERLRPTLFVADFGGWD